MAIWKKQFLKRPPRDTLSWSLSWNSWKTLIYCCSEFSKLQASVVQLAYQQINVCSIRYIQYPVPSVELTDPAGDPGNYLMDVAVQHDVPWLRWHLHVECFSWVFCTMTIFSFPSLIVFLLEPLFICTTFQSNLYVKVHGHTWQKLLKWRDLTIQKLPKQVA